jgi:dipeptidase E
VSGHVVAIGGGDGWFAEEICGLARRARPRVCFVGTATGDRESYVLEAYRAFAGLDCVMADLAFFERTVTDLPAFVGEQDVFWVGGGSTANLLAVWRLHGLDVLLREAYGAGAVLAGVSAGMNCWFESSTTDSFGPELAPLHDGLGILAGSACPHYDAEPQRRPLYRSRVDDGTLAPGWAVDNDAALHFAGGLPVEVLATRPGARAYRVEPGAETAYPRGACV